MPSVAGRKSSFVPSLPSRRRSISCCNNPQRIGRDAASIEDLMSDRQTDRPRHLIPTLVGLQTRIDRLTTSDLTTLDGILKIVVIRLQQARIEPADIHFEHHDLMLTVMMATTTPQSPRINSRP